MNVEKFRNEMDIEITGKLQKQKADECAAKIQDLIDTPDVGDFETLLFKIVKFNFDEQRKFLQNCSSEQLNIVKNFRMSVPEFMWFDFLKFGNLAGEELGVRNGWWEDWDKKGPIPNPIFFEKSDLDEVGIKFLSQLFARLEMFKSVGEAKKAGWNKPVQIGEFFVKHEDFKRSRIIIK